MPKKNIKRALKARAMLRSRRSKVEHFYRLFQPGMSVLDVGVTAKDDSLGSVPLNYLLKTYPYGPETYTGLAVQDVRALEAAYPGKRFIRYGGKHFPFRDEEFDWVFCNAVVEHVGDHDAQLLFVSEMLRVARYVFLTTPNKYFPIETHTHVPFIHWNTRLFDKWLWKNRPRWRGKASLRLLSARDIRRLLEESAARDFAVYKNRFLLWPMTLTVIASRTHEIGPLGASADAAPPLETAEASAYAGSARASSIAAAEERG